MHLLKGNPFADDFIVLSTNYPGKEANEETNALFSGPG